MVVVSAEHAVSCILKPAIANAIEMWKAYRSRDDERKTFALCAPVLFFLPEVFCM
jgi:hypothetical protein